jgi:aryl-alcohol dehydrogenase-like predicted oxidoreductase
MIMTKANAQTNAGIMSRRCLGDTSLTVSRAVLGTMTFGGQTDAAAAAAMVNLCEERGINFLDTANVYNQGRAEEILGQVLRGRRDGFILATKAGIRAGDGADDTGLSRAAIVKAIEASLRRLQTDHVDLFYLHQPDPKTPLDETLGTLDELVRAGKTRHVGASNFAAWQHCQMLRLADSGSRPRVTVAQPMYNLLARGIEQEFLPACQALGLATVAYNPLAGGLLTGKQPTSAPLPDTRFARDEIYRRRYWHDANFEAVTELSALAKQHGRSLVSLSLNWLLHHTPIDCVILGASRLAHLEENSRSLNDGPLPQEAVAQCDRIWEHLRGPSPKYNR